MRWQTTEAGHHCTEHDESFARGEVCARCAVEPDDAPGAPQLSEDVDAEIAADAQEARAHSRRLWREAEEMLDSGGRDRVDAAKLSAEAAKWWRAALEAKDKIAARKHLREAMEHEKQMSGVRH
jgi:hypothetical protein